MNSSPDDRPSGHSSADTMLDCLKATELRAARESARGSGYSTADSGSAAGQPVWGLALSGGGIRSAAFGLGVVQQLIRRAGFKRAGRAPAARPVTAGEPAAQPSADSRLDGTLYGDFDYLSTASGGGYTGGLLQALLKRGGPSSLEGTLSATGNDPHVLPWLRQHSNFLNPSKGLLSGDTLALIGRVVGPVLLVMALFLIMAMAVSLALLLSLFAFHWVAEQSGEWLLGKLLLTALCLGLLGVSAQWPPAGPLQPIPPRWRSAMNLSLLVAASVGLSLIALDPALAEADWRLWIGGAVTATIVAVQFKRASLLSRVRRSLVAAVTMGLFLAAYLYLAQWLRAISDPGQVLLALLFSPALMALLVYFGGVVYQSCSGHAISNQVREFWARLPARLLLIVGVAIPAVILTVFAGPYFEQLVRGAIEGAGGKAAGLGASLLWIGTTALALVRGWAFTRNTQTGQFPLPLVLKLALPVAALGLLLLIGWITASALILVADLQGVQSSVGTWGATLNLWAQCQPLLIPPGWRLLVGLLIALTVLLMLLDPNVISHSAFYADRLTRAFLAPSRLLGLSTKRNADPAIGFDSEDDLALADLLVSDRPARLRPYPLVCTAVNLSGRDQLDWQDRLAASFVLAPIWSGYLPSQSAAKGCTDARHLAAGDPAPMPGREFGKQRLSTQLSLGQAMAISGAAANPLMGAGSRPLLRVLMTLFNARLGWWVPNRARQGKVARAVARLPGLHLVREMLGMADLDRDFLHLSDGGHFENLAIYELVRRRCRFIVVCDAGADPDYHFEDLGRAVRLCRLDFGAEIRIDVSGIKPNGDGLCQRACAVGTIRYADGSEGTLLLIKPALTGQEPADVRHYAAANPRFPQQTTADQFFDEAQFESYRQLGLHIAADALRPLADESDQQVNAAIAEEEALNRLRRAWTPPAPVDGAAFCKHADTIASLFRELGEDSQKAFLVHEFYPEWRVIAPLDSEPKLNQLPAAQHLQLGFGLCQSLIQLMEQVYLDLKLDRFHDHPDNQGWMNVFHNWSWSPTFRLTWSLTHSIFGTRFIDFCQRHLGLADAMQMKPLELTGTAGWHAPGVAAEAMYEDLPLLNSHERTLIEGHLRLRQLQAGAPPSDITGLRVVPLSYELDVCRADESERIEICVGYAVLIKQAAGEAGGVSVKLLALRIRDHLRSLGHSRRFQSRLASAGVRAEVSLMDPNYGEDEQIPIDRLSEFAKQFNHLRGSAG